VTGNGWLDGTAVTAFAAVTVLALVRLARRPGRGLDRFLDDAFHAVMGIAMAAMFWPGTAASPARAWIGVIGLIVVWPLLVLALASGRAGPPGPSAGRVPTGPSTGRGPVPIGHAGYWLISALLMLVAVGAGHGRATMAPMAAHPPVAPAGPSALADALQAAAGWPIWPVVGVGFALYTGMLLLGPRRRPVTERVCAGVMAAGMAVMAFSV
jgi:hypothetical protein